MTAKRATSFTTAPWLTSPSRTASPFTARLHTGRSTGAMHLSARWSPLRPHDAGRWRVRSG
ncbi:MAG: hypothetical protein R3A52_06325 [Polyangiales bacterium]